MSADRADAPMGPDQRPSRTGGQNAGIDIGELAERVYRLMLAEARLERARGEGVARPRREQ